MTHCTAVSLWSLGCTMAWVTFGLQGYESVSHSYTTTGSHLQYYVWLLHEISTQHLIRKWTLCSMVFFKLPANASRECLRKGGSSSSSQRVKVNLCDLPNPCHHLRTQVFDHVGVIYYGNSNRCIQMRFWLAVFVTRDGFMVIIDQGAFALANIIIRHMSRKANEKKAGHKLGHAPSAISH